MPMTNQHVSIVTAVGCAVLLRNTGALSLRDSGGVLEAYCPGRRDMGCEHGQSAAAPPVNSDVQCGQRVA